MAGRAAVRIELEEAERAELEARARRRKAFGRTLCAPRSCCWPPPAYLIS